MKKNAMLKIAAVLLVAVLLTTCAISSTFAKYATKTDVFTDTATVAKWGITVKSVGSEQDLFVNDYGDAKGATAIVAPGTSKSISVSGLVEGQPEVDCQVTYLYKIVKQNLSLDNGHDPVVVKIDDTAAEVDGDWHVAKQLTYKVSDNKAIEDIDDAIDFDISWAWAFEEDANVNGAEVSDYDKNDTTLAGMKGTITVSVRVEVVQTNGAGDGAGN